MSETMERRAENGGGGGGNKLDGGGENNHEAGAFSLPLLAKVNKALLIARKFKKNKIQ